MRADCGISCLCALLVGHVHAQAPSGDARAETYRTHSWSCRRRRNWTASHARNRHTERRKSVRATHAPGPIRTAVTNSPAFRRAGIRLQHSSQRAISNRTSINRAHSRDTDCSSLREGEQLDAMDFRLHRGAVITGVITDEAGDPLPDVWVQVMRERFGPDGRSISLGKADTGADPHRRRRTISRVCASPRHVRGDGHADRSDDPTMSFGRTYYPGTMNESEAQIVRVDFGQDAVANFSMIPARRARVSGFVRDREGRPASGMRMTLNEPSGPRYDQIDVAMLGADGSFTFEHVLPGRYLLHVRPSFAQRQNIPAKVEWAAMHVKVSRRRYLGSDADHLARLRHIGSRDVRRLGRTSRDKGHSRRARDGLRSSKPGPASVGREQPARCGRSIQDCGSPRQSARVQAAVGGGSRRRCC